MVHAAPVTTSARGQGNEGVTRCFSLQDKRHNTVNIDGFTMGASLFKSTSPAIFLPNDTTARNFLPRMNLLRKFLSCMEVRHNKLKQKNHGSKFLFTRQDATQRARSGKRSSGLSRDADPI